MVEVIVKGKDQEIKVGDLVTWKKVTNNAESNEVDVFYVVEIYVTEALVGFQKRVSVLLIKSNDIPDELFTEHRDLPVNAFQKFYGEVIFRQ